MKKFFALKYPMQRRPILSWVHKSGYGREQVKNMR